MTEIYVDNLSFVNMLRKRNHFNILVTNRENECLVIPVYLHVEDRYMIWFKENIGLISMMYLY